MEDFQIDRESELLKVIQEHLGKLSEGQASLKEVSDLYDYLMRNRFEVKDMYDVLRLVLCCREQIDLDVFFFSKGMMYSSIKNHSVEEQIEFMYHLDKLNLLVHYIPRYL
jgi:hypothetical protein